MTARCASLAVALAACTSHHSTPADVELQMNDLSVMFPLPTSQAELDAMLAPSAAANGGQLLPQALLDSTPGLSISDTSALRAVAFRLDPCFGQLGAITDPSACHAQLRVVFEPVTFTPAGSAGGAGSAFVDDAAVHAFYALTSDQLVAAVRAVQQARQAAGGSADLGPLAPHPLVAAQGLTGTLATQLEQIVTQYAGAANMERMTAFEVADFVAGRSDLTGLEEFWDFDSFDVAAGSATPRMIPTLPSTDASNSMGVSASPDPLSTAFSPATTSADNLDVLASYSEATTVGSAGLGSAFDAALRIENPHDNSPDTIDCASCHMAQPAIELVGAQLGLTPSGNANAFVPDPSIPSADLAQTTMLVGSDGVLNIHAFSYRNASPMINQRVINETAANVAYVSTLLP